ncbi:MAG: hypothetical protein EOP04_02455 [Proteobacteria bacterium]|nr:MAG: hypothetical protein EOP04_02455 [Pseudomonadota bacterium]
MTVALRPSNSLKALPFLPAKAQSPSSRALLANSFKVDETLSRNLTEPQLLMEYDVRLQLIQNSCWTVYLHPFTFIVPDNEEVWEVDLNDINRVSYDHGKLVRIVTSFDIPNCNLSGFICYDGAISIPRIAPFESIEEAEKFFNSFIVSLVLNDFYVEGVDVRDIVPAQLLESWAIWNTGFGSSWNSQLHTKVRMKSTSNMDSIYLASPRSLKVYQIKAMLEKGGQLTRKINNLTPKFLNKGITELRYSNWDLALSNLWITAEQLVNHL